ncbi:MAG: VOC family protein [Puniceicoccales bacterium]
MNPIIQSGLAGVLLGLVVGCASGPNRPFVPSLADQSGSVATAGEFVWHDLVTPDAPSALSFYGDLFGWSFQSTADGYYKIYKEGSLVGGVVDGTQLGETPRSALWLNSIGTDDIALSLDRLEDAGGKALTAIAVLPNRGQVVQVEDPEGAIVQLVQLDGEDRLPKPGVWIWHDLLTNDPERSAQWYGEFSGIEAVPGARPDQYELVREGVVLATVSMSPFEETRSVWVPILAVDDLRAAVEKVPGLGGRVVISPDDALSNGSIAVILDPSGGVFAIQYREDME